MMEKLLLLQDGQVAAAATFVSVDKIMLLQDGQAGSIVVVRNGLEHVISLAFCSCPLEFYSGFYTTYSTNATL